MMYSPEHFFLLSFVRSNRFQLDILSDEVCGTHLGTLFINKASRMSMENGLLGGIRKLLASLCLNLLTSVGYAMASWPLSAQSWLVL